MHHGRNVRRFRELQGLRQDALATRLGAEWNQQKVSQLELSETIEADLLNEIAAGLQILQTGLSMQQTKTP